MTFSGDLFVQFHLAFMFALLFQEDACLKISMSEEMEQGSIFLLKVKKNCTKFKMYIIHCHFNIFSI